MARFQACSRAEVCFCSSQHWRSQRLEGALLSPCKFLGAPWSGHFDGTPGTPPESVPTAAVERSLSPPKYRGRFPFFAQEVEGHRLALPALTQNVMDLEIEQAVYAGLDFWAFVGYPGDSPMSVALQRYLASPAHSKMRFCMFTQLQDWGSTNAPAALIDEHIGLLNHESYLRVADGRPVYFLRFRDRGEGH